MNKTILLITGLVMTALVGLGQIPNKIKTGETYTVKSGLKITFHTVNPKAKQPVTSDKVKVHLSGNLLNDSLEWANTFTQPLPISLIVGETTIKGLDEALALMHEGDSVALVMPPDIGFGDSPMNNIPANSTLKMSVKLFAIVPPPKQYDTKGKDTVKLESGLQYIIISKGSGAKVDSGMKVTVHYSGFLTSGKSFDSSVERGEPISIPIGKGKVIKGWDEGITSLHVGDKARLIVPYYLGYGDQPYQQIPAKADLIFDVEVIKAETTSAPVPYDVKGKDTLTTLTGLGFITVKEGTGPQAKAGSKVKVDYTGYFTDGKIFDSSIESGSPFTFTLGNQEVIKGWDEGIAMMKAGGKARLIIPYSLGYGEQGYGPIPEKATLVFDVELLEIK